MNDVHSSDNRNLEPQLQSVPEKDEKGYVNLHANLEVGVSLITVAHNWAQGERARDHTSAFERCYEMGDFPMDESEEKEDGYNDVGGSDVGQSDEEIENNATVGVGPSQELFRPWCSNSSRPHSYKYSGLKSIFKGSRAFNWCGIWEY